MCFLFHLSPYILSCFFGLQGGWIVWEEREQKEQKHPPCFCQSPAGLGSLRSFYAPQQPRPPMDWARIAASMPIFKCGLCAVH